MDTMNLNAELFRELSYIADDESSMKKLLEYVKKLAAQQYGRREEAGEASLSSAVVAEFHRLSWRKMRKNIARRPRPN